MTNHASPLRSFIDRPDIREVLFADLSEEVAAAITRGPDESSIEDFVASLRVTVINHGDPA